MAASAFFLEDLAMGIPCPIRGAGGTRRARRQPTANIALDLISLFSLHPVEVLSPDSIHDTVPLLWGSFVSQDISENVALSAFEDEKLPIAGTPHRFQVIQYRCFVRIGNRALTQFCHSLYCFFPCHFGLEKVEDGLVGMAERTFLAQESTSRCAQLFRYGVHAKRREDDEENCTSQKDASLKESDSPKDE